MAFLILKRLQAERNRPRDMNGRLMSALALACIAHSAWADSLPESDALQNGNGLLFEFAFGSINAAKGEKHLIPQETIDQAARVTPFTIRARFGKDRLRLALHYDQLLRETPALTRKGLAGRLGITSARLNQILGLLKGGHGR